MRVLEPKRKGVMTSQYPYSTNSAGNKGVKTVQCGVLSRAEDCVPHPGMVSDLEIFLGPQVPSSSSEWCGDTHTQRTAARTLTAAGLLFTEKTKDTRRRRG